MPRPSLAPPGGRGALDGPASSGEDLSMHNQSPAGGRPTAWAAGLAVVAAILSARPAAAFTPESPEVKRAVGRAVAFLESAKATEHRPGGQALIGLALLRNAAKPEHPKVVAAVNAIRARLVDGDPQNVQFEEMYSPGIAIIFLIGLDPAKHASEIQCLLDYLQLQQKPHGGWGYPSSETGDTSMTQYAVLCSWEATQAGFRVPFRSIENVATWLLKTQDPSGGFGYQGTVSQSFTPVEQTQIRPSLSAAGLGSLYICANLLGVDTPIEDRDDELPSALKEVKPRGAPRDQPGPKTQLDPRLFRGAQARGNRWMAANYVIDPKQWTHYYLYALERCMSFREVAEKGAGTPGPGRARNWYDDGVRFLLKTQREDGSWTGEAGTAVDTAFSILFLTRSMKQSIEKARSFGDGTLIGGRGLPKETTQAEVRMGRVVAKSLLGPAEQLLAVLEDTDNPDYQRAIELLAELPSQQLEELIGGQAERLRRLAGGPSPAARIAALRALGKSRSLDNVPTLIYALGDDDPRVAREARDALRRISRNPAGFGLAEKPTEADRRVAAQKWKAWYLAVRPDAEFDD